MTKFLPFLALAVLAVFLLILAVKVATLDLWVVVLLTLGLAGFDFFSATRKKD